MCCKFTFFLCVYFTISHSRAYRQRFMYKIYCFAILIFFRILKFCFFIFLPWSQFLPKMFCVNESNILLLHCPSILFETAKTIFYKVTYQAHSSFVGIDKNSISPRIDTRKLQFSSQKSVKFAKTSHSRYVHFGVKFIFYCHPFSDNIYGQ